MIMLCVPFESFHPSSGSTWLERQRGFTHIFKPTRSPTVEYNTYLVDWFHKEPNPRRRVWKPFCLLTINVHVHYFMDFETPFLLLRDITLWM